MNGMDDNEDETDLFDDDDFDNLSESALQELEQNAIILTQRAQSDTRNTSKPPLQAVHESHTTPLSRSHTRPRYNALPPRLNSIIQSRISEVQSEDDSFELVGEEGVPTPVEEHDAYPLHRVDISEAAQGERFRQQRYGQAYDGLRYPHPSHPNPASKLASASVKGVYHGVQSNPDEMILDQPQESDANVGDDREAFRDRIEELMSERDELAQHLRMTNDTLSMQKGEISIIRANFEKERKVYDRQIGALKKQIEEESTKHSAAVNVLTEKNSNLTTRFHFLQQEHNQELQETKTLKQRLKDRPPADNDTSPTATPRRGMASSLRDGFDDDDIMVVSPSKSARRSKPSTPTAGNKRKRKANEGASPVKPLVLRASNVDHAEMLPPPPPQQQSVQYVEQIVPIVRQDKQAERNLRLIQRVLEYRFKTSRDSLFEAFVKFSFPSNPSKTLTSILLERTAQLQGSRLPSDLLQIFVDLWSKSLKEQYYKPVSLLVEIVNHVIDLEMSVLDTSVITTLSPVLQTAIAINAEKRFKHSPVNHATFGQFRNTPQSVLNQEVDGTACLELLLTVAYTISDDAELLALLWRLMDPEFVLMMLNVWQPISDITLTLRLLATSIFPNTFGCISDNQQEQIEHWLMNRICYLLWETPKVDEGLPPNTTRELCQLRLEAMDLLIKIAITSSAHPHDDPTHHGSQLIANDTSAIGRIVRSLHDEVCSMYELTPSHALHAELVNKGVSLLYHVLQHHGAQINLQQKLSVVNGGVHKHRVVLTRIAFSGGFYIDRLITDETVTMATSMLEESVTPDEADELIEAFPGFKGRGADVGAD